MEVKDRDGAQVLLANLATMTEGAIIAVARELEAKANDAGYGQLHWTRICIGACNRELVRRRG